MDWILFLLPISNFHLLHLFLRLLNTHHCNAICPHLQPPAITETAPGSDETVVLHLTRHYIYTAAGLEVTRPRHRPQPTPDRCEPHPGRHYRDKLQPSPFCRRDLGAALSHPGTQGSVCGDGVCRGERPVGRHGGPPGQLPRDSISLTTKSIASTRY